jgi:hypothetical protein
MIIEKYDGVGCYIQRISGMVFHGSSNTGSSTDKTFSDQKDNK